MDSVIGQIETFASAICVMLTHYTDSIEALGGILANGFAWVPNRRDLMPLLVPEHDFSRREPQQFGMISFTELEPEHANTHTEVFGPFGVLVSEEWARANRAERVIYVQNEGPAYEAWRSLFTVGFRDVKSRIKYPDDAGWLMSFENKAVAGAVAGSTIWAALLQLYEYMETADFSCECEWRIVNLEHVSIVPWTTVPAASSTPRWSWPSEGDSRPYGYVT